MCPMTTDISAIISTVETLSRDEKLAIIGAILGSAAASKQEILAAERARSLRVFNAFFDRHWSERHRSEHDEFTDLASFRDHVRLWLESDGDPKDWPVK